MANYLYGEYELPPLPKIDDATKKTYPCFLIAVSGLVQWQQSKARLYLLPEINVKTNDNTGASVIDTANLPCMTAEIALSNGVLVDGAQWSELEASVGGEQSNISFSVVKWTNTDILNEDGTLYLAASDPVPVSPVPINPALLVQSFFTGQAVRRMRGKPVAHTHAYTPAVTAPTCTEKGFTTYTCACGDSYTAEETETLGHDYVSEVIAPTTETEGYTIHTCSRCGDSYKDNYTEKLPGEPIAYLYNGVRLPDINSVWTNKETHPNAMIVQRSDYVTLETFQSVWHVRAGNMFYFYAPYKNYNLVNGEWVLRGSSSSNADFFAPGTLIWTTQDVYNQGDGTLFLAASDPVPVYE